MATSYVFLKVMKKKRDKKKLLTNDITTYSENKCRICLKEGSIPIFGTSANISQAVKTFGGIEIDEKDSLPKVICNFCYSLLQGAILFRKSAKETNERLIHIKSTVVQASRSVIAPKSNDSICDNQLMVNIANKPIFDSYKCKLCKLDFESHEEYVKHTNTKQHKNIRVQCPICYGLLTAQLYKKHLNRHQSASHLICEVCGKLYRKDNLIRHLQLHNFDLPYQCQICPYRGRFMESLKIHMRTHTGNKPFSCDKCQLRFLTRSNLNRHLLTHKKNKPFKCNECNRGFYTQKDADVHFKSDHAGIKDFSCCLCGNKYGTRKALMRHELRVHKRDKMAKGRIPLYLQEQFKK